MLLNTINIVLKLLVSASYAIIYIYANELFPTNVRNTGMGACSMIARIGAIIGTFCNDSLVSFYFKSLSFIDIYGTVFLLHILDPYLDSFARHYLWFRFSYSCGIGIDTS